jgi:hypothetical protein
MCYVHVHPGSTCAAYVLCTPRCAEADFFAACDRLGLEPTLLRLTAVHAEGEGGDDGGGGGGDGGDGGRGDGGGVGGEGGCRVRTLEGEAAAGACTAQVVALYSIRLRAAGSLGS